MLHRFLVAITAAACLLAQGCTTRPDPPNIVLVVIDTLRADHTSLHGYERETTPGLVRLAEQGTRFEQAYATTSSTAPTVATVFSGLYPIGHGLNRNGKALHGELLTMAEVLRNRGYKTAAVVSSFVLDAKFGFDQGFEAYLDDFDPARSKYPFKQWAGHEVTGAFDSRADATTDRVIDWLSTTRRDDSPFFLFVHYFDPHEPYRPPEPQRSELLQDLDPATRVGRIALYDAEIAFCDREIERLLSHLDSAGLAGDTLVVVTADHGQGLWQHGDPFHSLFLYEEDVRVPLIFRWPGRIAAGRSVPEPVGLIDLAPTLLDLAGGGVAFEAQGRNLTGLLLAHEPGDAQRPIFLQRQDYKRRVVRRTPVVGEKFAVREGKWKYILGPDDGSAELFDLDRDPGERHNVRTNEPATTERLAGQIRRWQETNQLGIDAEMPLSEADRERLRSLGYVE